MRAALQQAPGPDTPGPLVAQLDLVGCASPGSTAVNEYGTVVSKEDSPSTRRFSFVLNLNTIVRRGQFVQIDLADGRLIGRVADVYKTNRYYMRPESVQMVEQNGGEISDAYPSWEWEFVVADVVPLGVFRDGMFDDANFPPSPGMRVREPDHPILVKFFGLDEQGLKLGKFQHHDLDASLNLTRLLQKHIAVLSLSGGGKSHTVSVMIEELLNRKPEHGQVAVVVIDPHGEYPCFADDPAFGPKTRVFPIGDLKIGLSNLNSHGLEQFLPKLSKAQFRELSRVISSFKNGKGRAYTLADVIEAVEKDEKIVAKTKDTLISELYTLQETGLFGVSDYPALEDMARLGGLTVMDFSQELNMKTKQIAVLYLAQKLFKYRRQGLIPPFMLVLEEAHQFVPEGAGQDEALARWQISTIAREGRKFHASLCLISQRPKRLSTTVLSQCNTNIILRITNPYDLKHIEESSEGVTRDVIRQISSLKVGTGLIVGEAVNFPLFVKFRRRASRESHHGLSLEEASKEFYRMLQQQKRDAKSFM